MQISVGGSTYDVYAVGPGVVWDATIEGELQAGVVIPDGETWVTDPIHLQSATSAVAYGTIDASGDFTFTAIVYADEGLLVPILTLSEEGLFINGTGQWYQRDLTFLPDGWLVLSITPSGSDANVTALGLTLST